MSDQLYGSLDALVERLRASGKHEDDDGEVYVLAPRSADAHAAASAIDSLRAEVKEKDERWNTFVTESGRGWYARAMEAEAEVKRLTEENERLENEPYGNAGYWHSRANRAEADRDALLRMRDAAREVMDRWDQNSGHPVRYPGGIEAGMTLRAALDALPEHLKEKL